MSPLNTKSLPVIILAFELLLGGIARLSRIPFGKLHDFNFTKSQK
jgi:hypothetical protein